MYMFDYLKEFYTSLNTSSLVLFWTIIFFFFFLILSVVLLLCKNNELRGIINNLVEKQKEEEQKKYAGKRIKVETNEEETELPEKSSGKFITPEPKTKVQQDIENTGIYTKNVLKEIGTRDQTSPIAIGKKTDIVKLEELEETKKLEPISIVSEDYEEEYYEKLNDGTSNFVEEISKKIEEELEPTTIDLTEYEKDQEEEAIISYEELKENSKLAFTRQERYRIDTDNDDEFLKELKTFRSSL